MELVNFIASYLEGSENPYKDIHNNFVDKLGLKNIRSFELIIKNVDKCRALSTNWLYNNV